MSAAVTKILYVGIWLAAVAFAFLSRKTQRMDSGEKTYFRKLPFVLSFLIVWFFYAFSSSGHDYRNYVYIYENARWSKLNAFSAEPGYVALNVILKTLIPNAAIGIMVIKTALLGMAYLAIYDYREKIHTGFAVLGYLSFCYLDAFCLIRINLAAAMLLLAVSLYQNRGKKIAAAVMMALASMMHNTALIFAGVVLVYMLWFRDRKRFFYSKLLAVSIILVAARVLAIPLISFLLKNVPFLSHYEKYSFIKAEGSGLMQYVWHIPFVLILMETWHLGRRPSDDTTSILAATLVLAPFSLFFGTLGYSIEVIGRTGVYFNYLWSVGIPCYYAWRNRTRPNWNTILVALCIFLWNAYRMYWYISSALVTTGLDTYRFIWQ